ncbi:MAG: methyltransferase domain-containing protein [Chloroflexi bacterium]|nr:methyltransferase domain-containing protein [Chloroflexota bacterium]
MGRPPHYFAMTENRYARFSERYASGDTPWDSGITPPEIVELLAELPAGRALDLGCGSGTVIRALLRWGWRADGVDFVQRAIDIAASKLSPFPAETYRLFRHDVTRLNQLPALHSNYNLIIDIGCGHSINTITIEAYARVIAKRLAPGGLFMLYASHPRPDSTVGWDPRAIATAFAPHHNLLWEQRGDDQAIGAPASWYKMRKRLSA